MMNKQRIGRDWEHLSLLNKTWAEHVLTFFAGLWSVGLRKELWFLLAKRTKISLGKNIGIMPCFKGILDGPLS